MTSESRPSSVPPPHFRVETSDSSADVAAAEASPPANPRRIASNFAFLSLAELACRATSVLVTLYLTKQLGRTGFGRIEFGFNVVFWLVLIVRDGFEVIAARETARHPRLVRPLVNHILAVKISLASVLYALLVVASFLGLSEPEERGILCTYGLLLFTTAFGLDFVYRGIERMGLVALSLVLRTAVYAAGILLVVQGTPRLVWVPAWLVIGESLGIALVWSVYSLTRGVPRPTLGIRFVRVILQRGRPILAIYLSQTVLTTIDMMVVGLFSVWSDNGLYSAPQRLIAAVLTLGLIFQQVVFPSLARSWRLDPRESRRTLDQLVRLFSIVFVPMAIGASALAGPIVALLFPKDYGDAAVLLSIGIWRAPLLTVAFLFQSALIALNREVTASRFLYGAAVLAPPAIVLGLRLAGLPGVSAAMVIVAAGLWIAAYARLAAEGRAPVWHHHLGRPLVASGVMLLVALPMLQVHLVASVIAGALAYGVALVAIGGLRISDVQLVLFPAKGSSSPQEPGVRPQAADQAASVPQGSLSAVLSDE